MTVFILFVFVKAFIVFYALGQQINDLLVTCVSFGFVLVLAIVMYIYSSYILETRAFNTYQEHKN